eukprot:TRINITY_DN67610_c0_g1_i1.p1 TRINITY_DN67610_c0_g1~~TRINITY_DN67610_c0_g1_i1.p1  ORF type:complete len:445 (+),score=65.08 TRINITY_DN67610_c0_g1_i1:94-1428(+)
MALSVYTLYFCFVALTYVVVWLLTHRYSGALPAEKSREFKAFQRNYIAIYLLALYADWLKGPYVYALYDSYGYTDSQIAQLYICGHVSSLLLGSGIAGLADRVGRKRMCQVFCVFYICAAAVKIVNNFWVLVLGRIFAGAGTALLFSVFEAWMVSQHKACGFPDSLLANTFTIITIGNGFVAVLAGLTSELCAKAVGYVGPFLFAIAPLTVCGILLTVSWQENYGSGGANAVGHGTSYFAIVTGLRAVRHDRRLFFLGAAQALFEGAMYTWIFVWTPAMQTPETKDLLPYGMMFAAYMTCVMIGGNCFDLFTRCARAEHVPSVVHALAALAMAVPILWLQYKPVVYLCFLTFEFACGLFWPSYATMRSVHLSDDTRASVMAFFRIPLDIFVIVFLLSYSKVGLLWIFCLTTGAHLVGLASHHAFRVLSRDRSACKELCPGFISQ